MESLRELFQSKTKTNHKQKNMESYLVKTIYKLFPQQFNKIVFEKKHEGSDWKSKCELSFVDDSGVKYFKYKSDFQLPIQRMAYVDTLKLQYMQSWSKNEQNMQNKA